MNGLILDEKEITVTKYLIGISLARIWKNYKAKKNSNTNLINATFF